MRILIVSEECYASKTVCEYVSDSDELAALVFH